MLRAETYRHFGLGSDPWPDYQQTGDARRIQIAVDSALKTGGMVAVTGARGAGKTHALWRALGGHSDYTIIEPLRLDRENLHIGDIQRAIVTALSDETPRHSGEARAGQVRRLLRGAPKAVLVIDEAHLLHHQTVRALKRLRELGARGNRRALLPVLLVGQGNPAGRIAEVRLRTEHLPLTGLTPKEAGAILRQTLARIADPDAIEALAEDAAARNWLELQRLTDTCLAQAAGEGQTRLSAREVQAVLTPAPAEQALSPAPAPGAIQAALRRPAATPRAVSA